MFTIDTIKSVWTNGALEILWNGIQIDRRRRCGNSWHWWTFIHSNFGTFNNSQSIRWHYIPTETAIIDRFGIWQREVLSDTTTEWQEGLVTDFCNESNCFYWFRSGKRTFIVDAVTWLDATCVMTPNRTHVTRGHKQSLDITMKIKWEILSRKTNIKNKNKRKKFSHRFVVSLQRNPKKKEKI